MFDTAGKETMKNHTGARDTITQHCAGKQWKQCN